MADQRALRILSPGEQLPPGERAVPIIDLTTLVGDAFMQADLLRGASLTLSDNVELRDVASVRHAVRRMRDAADHIEQVAGVLGGGPR